MSGTSSDRLPKVKLPESRRLRFSLDPRRSCFGDEFLNAPEFLGTNPPTGRTCLSGWLAIRFEPAVANKSRFSLDYQAVGTDDELEWGGGQNFALQRNRLRPMRQLPGGACGCTGGVLDLETGRVDQETIRISAAFQNSLIAVVGALSRIPFFFPFAYPAPELPSLPEAPAIDMRQEHGSLEFTYGPGGQITGLALRAATNVPVSIFPRLGLFPPFSFGPNGKFHFARPTSYRPGVSAEDCPSAAMADGIHLPPPAYFHPFLELVSEDLPREHSPPPIPCLPLQLARPALVALSSQLYCCGGLESSGSESRQVFCFDRRSTAWKDAEPLPRAVAASGVAASEEQIFVLGGWTNGQSSITDVVQIFDHDRGTWRLGSPMPLPVAGASVTLAKGKIYVAGGWADGPAGRRAVDSLQIYEVASDRWQVGPPLPRPVADASAVARGDDIYVINGRADSARASRQVSVYSAAKGAWASAPPTPIGVCEAAAVDLGRRILLVGGRQRAGGPAERLLQQLEEADACWRQGLAPWIGTAGSGAAVLAGNLVLIGGEVQGPAVSDPGRLSELVQVFSPCHGWRAEDSRPVFSAADVMNAGAGVLPPRALSPGARAVIVGRHLTGPNGEAHLAIAGKSARILASSTQRIQFLVPDLELLEGEERLCQVAICHGVGAPVQTAEVVVASSAPNLFVLDYAAVEFDRQAWMEPNYRRGASALAVNADGSLNCPLQPAAEGDFIELLATGLGPLEHLSAEIDGQAVRVQGVAAVPGHIGVFAVALRIPAGLELSSNLHSVRLECGDSWSNPVTISVQETAYRPAIVVPLAAGSRTVLGDGQAATPTHGSAPMATHVSLQQGL